MIQVHPSAVVERGAELAEGVQVGPGAVIGPHVRVGPRTWIGPYVVLDGHTSLGADCRVYPHAVLGTPPQDVKYHEEPTRLEIGERNLIREFVTIHRGTPQGRGLTRIGSDVFLMASCHVAHDNIIEDLVIVANCVQLAGHVHLGAHAIVGGTTAIHQFVRVGAHAFVGGGSAVAMDVAPFCRAAGNRARVRGLNHVGLRRRGFSEADMRTLRRAYRLTFHANLLVQEAAERIDRELVPLCPALREFTAFLRTSERGLTR